MTSRRRADERGEIARRLPLAGGHRDRDGRQRRCSARRARRARRAGAASNRRRPRNRPAPSRSRPISSRRRACLSASAPESAARSRRLRETADFMIRPTSISGDRDPFAGGDRGGDLGREVQLRLGLRRPRPGRGSRGAAARTASSSPRTAGSTSRRCRCGGASAVVSTLS